jgi:cbb3-type cytochrome oxidase maturation protein
MSVIYVVLPLALVIAAGMVWAFVRSVRKGQFDDLDTPAIRMLFEDSPVRNPPPAGKEETKPATEEGKPAPRP